jgi:DNA-directed RNA polymerase specialized sigma24 family protein
MLVRYAQKLTRNRDRAEDLAQDTILRALAKAHLYSEKGILRRAVRELASRYPAPELRQRHSSRCAGRGYHLARRC